MAYQCPPTWHLPLSLRNQISRKRFLVPPKKWNINIFWSCFLKKKLLVFHGFFMDSDVLIETRRESLPMMKESLWFFPAPNRSLLKHQLVERSLTYPPGWTPSTPDPATGVSSEIFWMQCLSHRPGWKNETSSFEGYGREVFSPPQSGRGRLYKKWEFDVESP